MRRTTAKLFQHSIEIRIDLTSPFPGHGRDIVEDLANGIECAQEQLPELFGINSEWGNIGEALRAALAAQKGGAQ